MSDDKLIISIITVVRNCADALESTILSVLKQYSMHLIQYIIIDGNSTDHTLNVIRKYEDKIHYWVSESDSGIYDAMNKGWSVANINSFVLFLGAGDQLISLPEFKIKPLNQIFYGRVAFNNEKIFNSSADFRLKLGNTLHHQALLIPKRIHPSPPFDLKFKVYADFDFNQRLLKQGTTFTYLADFLSYAAPDGISSKFAHTEALLIVKKNFGASHQLMAIFYYLYQNIRNKIKNSLGL
jgi:glycosyltransferase involved in cell wall biosynthesis